ncbi:MAG TPA: redoxin domain-containing protein [Saprospiraceae bacterium]|nr:redoxin domain-containing protein [Saprospiraceae bacterium]
MQRITTILFFILALSGVSFAGSGYRIEVELQHYTGDTLKLGYYFGKAQYLKDTAVINKGKFVFEGPSALEPGVYLLVIPPDNKFVHVLIPAEEQQFSLVVDMDNIVKSAKFKSSAENEIYYDYLRELDALRPRADELKKLIREDSLNKAGYEEELSKIDANVKKIQDNIVAKSPKTMTAMLIKANQDLDIPKYPELSEEDRKQKQYEYYRTHYFDNFDLNDPRAIRSGLIQNKIDFFTQKLTYPQPDSQSVAIDYLLSKMDKNPEAFQYYLVYFLNDAAKSKRMGMDAVYVHLVDNYYSTGKATWADDEQLKKLTSQANSIRPTLIGKIAPDLTLWKENGDMVTIHGIQSPYTVLFFWDPECGHCKKATPFVVDFYNQYKDKGVEVLSICTKTGDDISECWSTVKERNMDVFVNTADQYLRSRYKSLYDVKTTPQIFILDQDKKILVKKIAGEDLKTVMDELLKSMETKEEDKQ